MLHLKRRFNFCGYPANPKILDQLPSESLNRTLSHLDLDLGYQLGMARVVAKAIESVCKLQGKELDLSPLY